MTPSVRHAPCPVCGNAATTPVFDIAGLPVHSTVLWPSREEAMKTVRGDMRLTFCDACGHMYNSTFDSRLIEYTTNYENSLHHSGVFQGYMEELASSLVARYALRGKTVLEIGCGQGDFLAYLCDRAGCTGIGFDPSYIAAPAAGPGYDRITIVQDFYSEKYADRPADLIICRQVLEHIDTPRTLLAELRRSLGARKNTAVFFEVPSVLYHIRASDLWAFVYEHVSFFSPASLAALFTSAGYDVLGQRDLFETQFLGIETSPSAMAHAPLPEDQPARLQEIRALAGAFSASAGATLDLWETRFRNWAVDGKRVVVWGGGARCTNFLNMVKGSSMVEAVVDINPRKHGSFIAGSGQGIVAPEVLPRYNPSVVVLLNPIYEREIRSSLAGLGVTAEIVGV
jgi:SAM-dependent methyltransferase